MNDLRRPDFGTVRKLRLNSLRLLISTSRPIKQSSSDVIITELTKPVQEIENALNEGVSGV